MLVKLIKIKIKTIFLKLKALKQTKLLYNIVKLTFTIIIINYNLQNIKAAYIIVQ